MKKLLFKIISIALTLSLCCVFLPTNVFAAEYITNLSYDFNDLTNLPNEIKSGVIVDDPAISDGFIGKSVKVEGGNGRLTLNTNLSLKADRTYKFKFYLYPTNSAWYGIVSNVWSAEKNDFVWDSSIGNIAQQGSGTPRLPNLTAGVWNLVEFTYTPTIDRGAIFFNFGSLGAYYVDDLEITDVTDKTNQNTSVRQSYDFDNTNFKAYSDKLNNSIQLAAVNGEKNSVLKLAPTASAQAKINVELDYSLETGNYYKLSFDYKGTAKMRILHNFGAWANLASVDVVKEEGPNSGYDAYFNSSNAWIKYDTIFYTEQASTHLYLLLVAQADTEILIDNIKIEKCDTNGTADTIFPSKYVVDFEDETTDVLGVSPDSGFNFSADPKNENNRVLKHTGAYGSFFIPEARLKEGHDYVITYDYYVPTQTATDPSIRNTLRNRLGAKISPDYGWTNTWSNKDVWKKMTVKISNASTGAFFHLYILREVYIDNIVIRDLTPDIYTTDYEDEEILNEDDTNRTEVTYVNDADYGKVAQISYQPVVGLGGYTKFPVRLKDGEAYKVTFTYKTDGWATVHYASKTTPAVWALSATSKWKTTTYYITGTGDADYFGFRCNNATDVLNLQIANVIIERQTYNTTTDINYDGASNATDVSLLRSYLLNGPNDLKFFEKYTEQNGIDGVDIRDLVSLNNAVSAIQ